MLINQRNGQIKSVLTSPCERKGLCCSLESASSQVLGSVRCWSSRDLLDLWREGLHLTKTPLNREFWKEMHAFKCVRTLHPLPGAVRSLQWASHSCIPICDGPGLPSPGTPPSLLLWPGCWEVAHSTSSFLLEAKSNFFLWRPGLELSSANECKPSASSNGKSGMMWRAVACFQGTRKALLNLNLAKNLKHI